MSSVSWKRARYSRRNGARFRPPAGSTAVDMFLNVSGRDDCFVNPVASKRGYLIITRMSPLTLY